MSETVEELRAKLAQNAEAEAELRAAIKDADVAALERVRADVRAMVAESGFGWSEVVGIDPGKAPMPRKARNGETPAVYRLRSDPTLTYVRGRMPNWMFDAMADNGLDPKKAEDRKGFRDQFMDAT